MKHLSKQFHLIRNLSQKYLCKWTCSRKNEKSRSSRQHRQEIINQSLPYTHFTLPLVLFLWNFFHTDPWLDCCQLLTSFKSEAFCLLDQVCRILPWGSQMISNVVQCFSFYFFFIFYFCRGKQLAMADLGTALQIASSNWINNKGKGNEEHCNHIIAPRRSDPIWCQSKHHLLCSCVILDAQRLGKGVSDMLCLAEPFQWAETTGLNVKLCLCVWELYNKAPLPGWYAYDWR